MTDRAKGCWVAFDHDIRVDDAESLVNAIKALRGVADVDLQITTPDDYMARQQVRIELADKFAKLFSEVLGARQ